MAELVARAVPYSDGLHINWTEARFVLGDRRGPQVWSELKALQHHPGPVHRLFLADVVWSRNSMTWFNDRQDVAQDADFLTAWVLDEPDGIVLARVLEVYADQEHPEQETIGLRYADHPDPRVPSRVSSLIPRETPPTEAATITLLALSRDPDVRCSIAGSGLTSKFREALLTLIRDTDSDVRACAAISLGNSDDRTAAVTDALVALLDEENQLLRLEIYALARRDDPRTKHAWECVGRRASPRLRRDRPTPRGPPHARLPALPIGQPTNRTQQSNQLSTPVFGGRRSRGEGPIPGEGLDPLAVPRRVWVEWVSVVGTDLPTSRWGRPGPQRAGAVCRAATPSTGFWTTASATRRGHMGEGPRPGAGRALTPRASEGAKPEFLRAIPLVTIFGLTGTTAAISAPAKSCGP
ncbi:hypothetical protein [Streptomyces sp. NPDC005141]